MMGRQSAQIARDDAAKAPAPQALPRSFCRDPHHPRRVDSHAASKAHGQLDQAGSRRFLYHCGTVNEALDRLIVIRLPTELRPGRLAVSSDRQKQWGLE